ncbi:MAG TPA: DUF1634 domain-containing protein [Bryobacteraceae bacterium]|nr:DUF1634 domain-containing protein [Bryobacteraceae bacterium]
MPNPWTDERVQQVIGKLLRYGVTMAAIVVLAGGILYLFRHGGEPAEYSVFHGEPSELRHLDGILRGVAALDELSLIQFGLLLLIATPVARVAFSMIAFALERDRLYVAITGFVFAVLFFSLAGGS